MTDKKEIDEFIGEMEKKGVQYDSHTDENGDLTGLGDVVESVLTSMGVTQEKFKSWFNLEECNCTKRKKWLNNILSWKKNS